MVSPYIDIENSEIDTPVDEVTEEGRIIIEDGWTREGLAIFVYCGHDFTAFGSCLNAAKGMYQTSFDRILLRLDAAAPSLLNLIAVGTAERSQERLQYWGEFWICLSLNRPKYRKSSFR